MKKILKLLALLLFVFFLSLYLSKYTNTYYENKKVLTDEAIKEYEKDLKTGQPINSKNYLKEEKNYNNKASRIGLKTSNLIEKGFNSILKYSARELQELTNN